MRFRLPHFLLAISLAAFLDAPAPARASAVGDPEIDPYRIREDYIGGFADAVDQAQAAFERDDEIAALRWLRRSAWLAYEGGDRDLSLRIFEALARRLEGMPDPDARLELAQARLGMGILLREFQDPERGAVNLDSCEALLGNAPRELPTRAALLQARAVLLRSEDPDAAIGLYRRALALRRERLPQPSLDTADNGVWLAYMLFRAGRAEEGWEALDQADRELMALGAQGHSLRGTVLELRAESHLLRHEWQEAERIYRESMPYFSAGRRSLFSGYASRRIMQVGQDDLALCRLEQGDVEGAWSHLQMFRSGVADVFALLASWRELSPENHDRREALRARLFDMMLDGRPDAGLEDLVEVLAVRAELESMEREFLNRFERPVPNVAELQAVLAPGEAYVSRLWVQVGGWFGNSERHCQAWLFVVRPGEPVRAFRERHMTTFEEFAALMRDLEQHNRTMQYALDWRTPVEPDPGLRDIIRRLSSGFRDLSGILENDTHLIVETAHLWTLNTSPVSGGSDEQVLLDRFIVTGAFSARSFVDMRSATSESGPHKSILALGDPQFDRTESWPLVPTPAHGVPYAVVLRSPYTAADTKPRNLPRLPYSRTEVQTIARRFPQATVLTGDRASEDTLAGLARSDRLREFDVLHFATHTAVNPAPSESGLIVAQPGEGELGDGVVTTREIQMGWALDADLVVLSCCRGSSSSGTDSSGERLGCIQALLGVGARNVIASPFRLDDAATSLLMQRFYENLAGREGVEFSMAEALRDAQLWLRDYRDASGKRPYAHPVYWSDFVLIGSGR